MKRCKYCNNVFPELDFDIALTTEDKVYRRHKCRNCYQITKKKLRHKYRDWLFNYKARKGCQNCGIKDARVLDFHHVSKRKEFGLSSFTKTGFGFDRIKKEVAKCEVVCANCHRIIHYEETNRK